MLRFTRRGAVMAAAALALAACGSSSEDDASSADATKAASDKVVLQDIIFGDPDAPVTLIEYASWTCPACLSFHTRIMPTVQADYIDTGKVRLVFREFPTAPANVTVAGFAIARCAPEERYYDVLDELFVRQDAILTLARQGGPVVEALKQIAANHGIDGDDAFQACLDDQGNRDAIRASIAAATAKDVNATPTFFLNGEQMSSNDWITPVSFSAALDAAISAAESD
ncbi:MAG: thioredoxin domain-containing protein [Pseudomonadota bacterium]